ncbi:MAG: hypothetical protein ACM4AI_05110 [Acidobacteriota bacterium]
MNLRQRILGGPPSPRLRQAGLSAVAVFATTVAAAGFQSGAETFTATATVKSAAGATASAPITIVVDRKMPQAEAEKFMEAFRTGGAAALRKALTGVPPTGSVTVGGGAATPTRLTLERRTDKGRLLTIVADKPILALGAGLPDAKPKTDYDFAVVDLEVNDSGAGTGQFAPAAKISVNKGAFVVSDYSSELIRLTGVKKVK